MGSGDRDGPAGSMYSYATPHNARDRWASVTDRCCGHLAGDSFVGVIDKVPSGDARRTENPWERSKRDARFGVGKLESVRWMLNQHYAMQPASAGETYLEAGPSITLSSPVPRKIPPAERAAENHRHLMELRPDISKSESGLN